VAKTKGEKMSKKQKHRSHHQLWAEFRFGVVGGLLSAPASSGELADRFRELSQKEWQHPITEEKVIFGVSTIERWYYEAKNKKADPVGALRRKLRSDSGTTRHMSQEIKSWLMNNHRQNPQWSYQLHVDNLKVWLESHPECGMVPSYASVLRYMKTMGWLRRKRAYRPTEPGQAVADARLCEREVRRFEVEYVGGLWHLDFHKAKRGVLTGHGELKTPIALCILDDHSRLCCHIQWFFNEDTPVLVHGFVQALLKRGLPRALLTDNGSAMISTEFTQGLTRLGINHDTTLPYSPYQNGKQESFWGNLEGRLMAMLINDKTLTLPKLNDVTQAWCEVEYNKRLHSETSQTPLDRFIHGKDVLRPAPENSTLSLAFRKDVRRTQRRSDGTFSLEGKRFEVPNAYRSLPQITVRYASWDLTEVHLIDDRTQNILTRLFPVDLQQNAEAKRRVIHPDQQTLPTLNMPEQPPLLEKIIAEYSATGLPPAYIPVPEREVL
jgi:putative transposase